MPQQGKIPRQWQAKAVGPMWKGQSRCSKRQSCRCQTQLRIFSDSQLGTASHNRLFSLTQHLRPVEQGLHALTAVIHLALDICPAGSRRLASLHTPNRCDLCRVSAQKHFWLGLHKSASCKCSLSKQIRHILLFYVSSGAYARGHERLKHNCCVKLTS